MKRLLFVALAATAVLAGCGEKSQSQADARDSGDVPPYQGAKDPFVAKGWTPGNKTEWDNQMRTRTQTQNEYVKIGGN